jgi:hypothetical protein
MGAGGTGTGKRGIGAVGVEAAGLDGIVGAVCNDRGAGVTGTTGAVVSAFFAEAGSDFAVAGGVETAGADVAGGGVSLAVMAGTSADGAGDFDAGTGSGLVVGELRISGGAAIRAVWERAAEEGSILAVVERGESSMLFFVVDEGVIRVVAI